jgi:PAS domain S-box-containing protein
MSRERSLDEGSTTGAATGLPVASTDADHPRADPSCKVDPSGPLPGANPDELDHIAALVCQTLDVPIACVTLGRAERADLSGAHGISQRVRKAGGTPRIRAFRDLVITSGQRVALENATADHAMPARDERDVEARLGVPVMGSDGAVVGSVCALDTGPRVWTPRDFCVLEGFARLVALLAETQNPAKAPQRARTVAPAQQAMLTHIIDTAPVPIAHLAPDLTYAFANTAYAALFGLSPDAITGLHCQDVLGDRAFALTRPHLENALAEKPVLHDLEMLQPDRQSRILQTSYSPGPNVPGQARGIIVTVTDVTEQRLLSTLAERLDVRLKAAHQVSPDGFMVFKSRRNTANRIIDFEWEYTNEPGALIVGKQVQDLIGKNLLDLLPGNKAEGLFDAYVNVVNSGTPYRHTSLYQHDGLSLWISVTAVRLGDGFAVSFADVTERKRAELSLADSAHRLQRILDNVVAFVGVLSPDGVLREANQPALDIAGLRREDVIGIPFWEAYWWQASEDTQTRLKQAIEDAKAGQKSRYDVEIQVAEGRKIWIDFQLSPRFDSDGKMVEMIPSGTDITERKRAETHRELLVNELNHRVKNTLATIQAMARQTIRMTDSLESFETHFTARLRAISVAHEILVGSDDAGADLRTMIDRQVGPYVDQSRQLKVSGDRIRMSGECAHSVGLILHELATNAAKYGALSNAVGHVDIIAHDMGDGTVKIVWAEVDGPPVSPPERTGFGSRLIKQSIELSLGGYADVNYAKQGVVATLIVPNDFDHG